MKRKKVKSKKFSFFKKDMVITLLVCLIVVVLSDIAVRLWFAKDLHLVYDSTIFNNVVTPIASIVAVVAAIYLTVRQNKIALSQGLKPHYEKEIENEVERLRKLEWRDPKEMETKTFDGLNWAALLFLQLTMLGYDQDLINDVAESEKGVQRDHKYYSNRTYSQQVNFMYNMIFRMTMSLGNVMALTLEIKSGKLIIEDQNILVGKIRSTFFSPIEFLKTMAESSYASNYNLILPVLFEVGKPFDGEVKFQPIMKNDYLVELLDFVKDELS